MKQVMVQGGSVVVLDVPAPQVSNKNILVRVTHSCISVGTEMAGVKMSGLPLYKRALKQPENVKRVLDMMRDQGIKHTMDRVLGKLSAGSPTGYSAAGIVIEVGSEVEGFAVGDRVACAGAGIANHAELIDVPVNLAVLLPNTLAADVASTVTLGAIAMQGVRRAQPTLGEIFVVIGLGILGQLTCQFLHANGCKVIGVDLDTDRIKLAIENGLDFGIDPSCEDYVERVHKLTDGFGADAVIITAASDSSKIISDAMQATRKKGRVVLVGDVGLDLQRADFYKKELDFLISSSYGPGRYDPIYEEGGQDYPLPFVRWTENRNMEAYLHLLASGKVSLANLYHPPYPVERAKEAYDALKGEGRKPLLVLLEYPESDTATQRKVVFDTVPTPTAGKIRVGLAGAGGYAQGMHLPNMIKLRDKFSLQAVMSRTGSNARTVAAQNKACYATTDYADLLSDPDVDLVIIATRHNLHAGMVLQALEAGKHVFVEKPLALNETDLVFIENFYQKNPNGPLLMTGFNRRFSPAMARAKEVLKNRTTPMIVNYRMNAGYIPLDHWVHTTEGGGRNIGEACHIYDLFNYLTDGACVEHVHATSMTGQSKQWARNDNFIATIKYVDGSICTLTYTALGDKSYPKERMEIFSDGKVITMDDFKLLSIAGGKHAGWNASATDKGQFQELVAIEEALSGKTGWPISLADQIQATRISLSVEEQIIS
ncbi:bi-domain-containing oxidoreductase [Microvirgula aerodenitrificans]|uniref:bi-domain-containing oxidoreductase n=1 Tax=Microvirgula aerodenitrificans TaxID=57480 RepID=UPI002F42FBFC